MQNSEMCNAVPFYITCLAKSGRCGETLSDGQPGGLSLTVASPPRSGALYYRKEAAWLGLSLLSAASPTVY